MKHNLMAFLVLARPLVVAGLWFVGTCTCAGSQDPSGPETNPMLHAVGAHLVDAGGNPVLLRGVNLGGWLDWEGWMFSEGFISETEILRRLEMLAGSDATQAFGRGIYSNFIAAEDLRKIAALGFNLVRVPVNYRRLDSQAHKAVYEEAGWQKVMAWINRPILRQKPTTAETREAITEFLGAVKLENGQLDKQMLQELLPQ